MFSIVSSDSTGENQLNPHASCDMIYVQFLFSIVIDGSIWQ
jgi:hypothetical protein